MKKCRLYFIVVFFIICHATGVSQTLNNEIQTGLSFRSQGVNQDERTSLNLTPDAPLNLPKGFTLSFDLRFNGDPHSNGAIYFGYILRIIASDTTSFDLISNYRLEKISALLVCAQKSLISTDIEMSGNENVDKWMNVEIVADNKLIRAKIGDRQVELDKPLNSFSNIQIHFGRNDHPVFHTTDVPPISIRNVMIKDSKGETKRHWKMGKHGMGYVLDSIRGHVATVNKGVWNVDEHASWKMNSSFVSDQNAQIATDTINGRVFIATCDKLYTYYVEDKRIDSVQVAKGMPFIGASSHLIYDYKTDRLISYCTTISRLNPYNWQTREWVNENRYSDLPIQHHNRFINPETDELTLFGGYGMFLYSGAVYKHKLDEEGWLSTDLSTTIPPRYLGASVYLGRSKMLILGGYGSLNGEQQVSPHNYSDLYQIDTDTGEAIKLGEIENLDVKHCAFANSLVVNYIDNSLYTLAYNNHKYHSMLHLLKVNTETMKYSVLADSIPYKFLDIKSFCDLFYYKKTGKLYTIIQEDIENSESQQCRITFYSLNFPPLTMTDIIQSKAESHQLLLSILTLLVILVTGAVYLFLRKKRKSVIPKKIIDEIVPQSDEILDESVVASIQTSSIILLGGFQVFDKEGSDITGLFTPILRQLFLFLFLESILNGKGVSSHKLHETFWFDMDKSSASNNRSVNIRKLRLILSKLDDVKIVNENSYWFIEMGDNLFCDYQVSLVLLNKVGRTKKYEKRDIIQLVDLNKIGSLLPNIDVEWVDKYKSGYSNMLVEVLLEASKTSEIGVDLRFLVRLADVILLQDSIDEYAIRIKCQSLSKLGQKGLSKQTYDKFCEEHVRLLNEKPEFGYDDIVT